MEESRLQNLLMSEEYNDLEDHVLVEGPFIELDKRGDAVKQVILGLTRDSFLVAKDVIPNYRKFPSVKYDADVDLNVCDLEMEWIIPVCYLEIQRVQNEQVINVLSQNGRHRYYMIANIGGNVKRKWSEWMERIKYLNDDPYGYIKQLYNQWNDNFDLVDVENEKKKTDSSTSLKMKNSGECLSPASYRRRTRAKSIVPENWHDMLGIKTSEKDLAVASQRSLTEEKTILKNVSSAAIRPKKKKKKLRFNLPKLKRSKTPTCSCFG